MLRFLSNYLFQNENQPENDDPTATTPSSNNSEQQGPKRTNGGGIDDGGLRTKEESMDFVEGERGGESDEDEDDWVLIGDGEKGKQQQAPQQPSRSEQGESLQLQAQPVSLVAAPSEDARDKLDGGDEEDDDDEEEDEEEEEQVGNLLWENKLIEHPSMSVYVDLATSINSNGVNCVSMSSIAPTSSPGESVIVISGHDDDESSDSDDEDMEVVQPEVKAPSPSPIPPQEDISDMENNNNFLKKIPPTQTPTISAPLQNGRRKKGHYPCSSSNSSQLPRRAHLRSSAGGNNRNNNQTFQMISSNSWSSNNSLGGQTPTDAMHESMKRKRGPTAASAGNGQGAASACGIAMVGGVAGASPVNTSMINKNLKLVEIFPTAARSAKRRHRRSPPPQSGCTHPKGHFLQESRRRQDLQNCNKRSFVNNDRRSAQQRRVQKGAANGQAFAGAGGARSK